MLTNRQGLRVAVIVNDMSEVNIDASLVRGGQAGAEPHRGEAGRDDQRMHLLHAPRGPAQGSGKAGREGRFDYLLIESTGISEPMPVAETFTFADEEGDSLSDVSELDTMVTVVDARNFLNDFGSTDDLVDRRSGSTTRRAEHRRPAG